MVIEGVGDGVVDGVVFKGFLGEGVDHFIASDAAITITLQCVDTSCTSGRDSGLTPATPSANASLR
jgi:hypothetical protein